MPWSRIGLLLLALIALPAAAAVVELDAGKLSESYATVPLATICAVLTLAVGYLFRELMKAKREHLQDVAGSHAQVVEVLTMVLPVQSKVSELGGLLEHAADSFNDFVRREREGR